MEDVELVSPEVKVRPIIKPQVGDRVKTTNTSNGYDEGECGVVIYVGCDLYEQLDYLVEFDKAKDNRHDGDGKGKPRRCFWCNSRDLIKIGSGFKYDVGDKVRVRKDLEAGKFYSMEFGKESIVGTDMLLYRGEVLTIVKHNCCGKYEVKENKWYWTDEMFEKKVMFNAGDVVKFDNEEKHRKCPEWYPKVGTLGIVIRCEETYDKKDYYLSVQWEAGSISDDDCSFCDCKDVVKINPNT